MPRAREKQVQVFRKGYNIAVGILDLVAPFFGIKCMIPFPAVYNVYKPLLNADKIPPCLLAACTAPGNGFYRMNAAFYVPRSTCHPPRYLCFKIRKLSLAGFSGGDFLPRLAAFPFKGLSFFRRLPPLKNAFLPDIDFSCQILYNRLYKGVDNHEKKAASYVALAAAFGYGRMQ